MSAPAKKLKIQRLSSLVSEKRQRMEALGMINMATDEAKRIRQSMAYQQALSEFWSAQDALAAAISAKG